MGTTQVSIPCRQLSFATAKQTRRSFYHVCRKLKCENPFVSDTTLVNRMTYFQSEYVVRAPTGTYDPLDFIPKAFEAIDQLAWCALKKLQAKTIQLLSLHHGLRSSNLGPYCPFVEDILLPPATELLSWCSDGLPMFIVIGYRRTKTKRRSQSGDRDRVWLMVHRNLRSPAYCTMTFIFLWLAASGISAGPLFVMIKQGVALKSARKEELLVENQVRNYVTYFIESQNLL